MGARTASWAARGSWFARGALRMLRALAAYLSVLSVSCCGHFVACFCYEICTNDRRVGPGGWGVRGVRGSRASREVSAEETHAIMHVRLLPPSESWRRRVSLLSR